jgi:hypothetical protein
MSTSVRSCKQAESRSRSSCPRSKAGSAAASAPRPIAGRRRARPGVRKVGAAVLHHDDFAVEDRSRDGDRTRPRSTGSAWSNPIQSGPGVDPRPALVEVKLEPIAVVLDFVEPVVAGGRLGSQRGELGGMNPGIADGFEPVDRSREKPRLGTLRQLRKLAKFRPGPEDNGGQSTGYFPKAANGQTRT